MQFESPLISRVLDGILSERVDETFLRVSTRSDTLPRGPALPPALQLTEWIANPIGLLATCRERYGDVFTLRFPQAPPFVLFSDPDAVKEIFTGDTDALRAGEANVILEPILGKNSVILLDGPRHLSERRLMMPSFHGERMQAYVAVMRDVATRALRAWPNRGEVRVHEVMQEITLDVIVHTVFGVDEVTAAARLRKTLAELLNVGSNPLWLMPFVQKDLGPRSPWGRIVALKRRVDAELYALIASGRVRSREGREDILSMLIDARDETGRGLTDHELHDEMLTLLIAGHETTATTLSWMFHWLSQHPEVQELARKEVNDVTGGAELDARHVPALKYLDAVCKETLRLTPVVPLVGRHVAHPVTIAGHPLPKDSVAVPSVYLTHRNEAYWPNPDAFDPMRFVDTRINPYAFLPFGGGTRRCLGLAFAMTELRVVMATVLQHVRVMPVEGQRTRTVRRGVTFVPSNGMPVIAYRLV